jgi:hypothetical protein
MLIYLLRDLGRLMGGGADKLVDKPARMLDIQFDCLSTGRYREYQKEVCVTLHLYFPF